MADDLTAADFWRDVIAAHKLDPPPAGAMTTAQFAHLINKSMAHARVILKGYVDNGVMQSGTFGRPEDGKPVIYYWQKGE